MDKQATLMRLAQGIAAASAAEDWPALAALQGALAPELRALLGQAQRSRGEQAALLALRAAHATAAQRCASAADLLAQRLASIRNNQEGWLAYALEAAINLDTTSA